MHFLVGNVLLYLQSNLYIYCKYSLPCGREWVILLQIFGYGGFLVYTGTKAIRSRFAQNEKGSIYLFPPLLLILKKGHIHICIHTYKNSEFLLKGKKKRGRGMWNKNSDPYEINPGTVTKHKVFIYWLTNIYKL